MVSVDAFSVVIEDNGGIHRKVLYCSALHSDISQEQTQMSTQGGFCRGHLGVSWRAAPSPTGLHTDESGQITRKSAASALLTAYQPNS